MNTIKESDIACIYNANEGCPYEDMQAVYDMTKDEQKQVDSIKNEIGIISYWTGNSDCDKCPLRIKLDALRILNALKTRYKLTELKNTASMPYSTGGIQSDIFEIIKGEN